MVRAGGRLARGFASRPSLEERGWSRATEGKSDGRSVGTPHGQRVGGTDLMSGAPDGTCWPPLCPGGGVPTTGYPSRSFSVHQARGASRCMRPGRTYEWRGPRQSGGASPALADVGPARRFRAHSATSPRLTNSSPLHDFAPLDDFEPTHGRRPTGRAARSFGPRSWCRNGRIGRRAGDSSIAFRGSSVLKRIALERADYSI